jgi:hypothetical protein
MGTLDVAITNDEVAALWPDRPELGPPLTIIDQQQIQLRFTINARRRRRTPRRRGLGPGPAGPTPERALAKTVIPLTTR